MLFGNECGAQWELNSYQHYRFSINFAKDAKIKRQIIHRFAKTSLTTMHASKIGSQDKVLVSKSSITYTCMYMYVRICVATHYTLTYPFAPSRTTFRSSPYLVLIHLMPCS